MMNILIVDDHEVAVKGIQITLEEIFKDVKIESSSTFPEAITLLSSSDYDLIILDIDIPGGGNTRMISRIRDHRPFTKILMCSGLSEEDNCLNYLRAGANGFIHKNAPTEKFTIAVNTVLGNKTFISSAMQQEILELALSRKQIKTDNIIKSLTKREYEIAKMIIQGKYTKEIASYMKLKENTISTFKKKILTKLGVKNAIELSNVFSKEYN